MLVPERAPGTQNAKGEFTFDPKALDDVLPSLVAFQSQPHMRPLPAAKIRQWRTVFRNRVNRIGKVVRQRKQIDAFEPPYLLNLDIYRQRLTSAGALRELGGDLHTRLAEVHRQNRD